VKQYRRTAADELAALTCVVLKLGGLGTGRSWSVVNIDQTLRTDLGTFTHAYRQEKSRRSAWGAIKQVPTG
jgi:hypothetical protein